MFAVGFLGLLTFMAIFADYLSFIPYPDAKIPGPNGRPGRYNWGPGWTAWFGTDGVSNDVFSKTIYGARTSLQVGVFATVFGIFVGGVLGVIAGYFRGWVVRVVIIITDCLLAIVYEKRTRPPEMQYQPWIDRQWAKVTRGLDHLDAHLPRTTKKLHGGHFALAALLGYLDLRFEGQWQKGRPRLKNWPKKFEIFFAAYADMKPQA